MSISDQTYLHWQNRLKTDKWFGRFWRFWGLYAILIYGALGGWMLFLPRGWWVVAMCVVAALVVRYVICEAIKIFYKKMHPYQRLGFLPPRWWLFSWTDKEPDAFPSQHSACAAIIGMIMFFFEPTLGLLGLLTAVMIGVGRIVMGYHDTIDVIAGWLVGLLSGWAVVYWLAPMLFTR